MIDYGTLNPEQREAVMSDCPRILTLAGAGTGKTRVLTMRIARLFETGVSPANMLALTFTRAAGAEMKSRVIGLIGEDGKKLFANTFHAWCAEAVRENAEAIGYEPNFSIYDQTDAGELLNQVITEMKYKITLKQAKAPWSGLGTIQKQQAESAMNEYGYRLKTANAMDFDGLISSAKKLMRISETFTRCHGQYKYVFVDEFQDTDPDQWELINLLSPENLFIVGDDFQSVYKFRGADVSIILKLAENPTWKVIKLERNYRSTKPIIVAANALIKHNNQTEKTLTTERDGEPVWYRTVADEESEILCIADELKDAIEREKTAAILARTNRQLETARLLLTEYGVPCEKTSADSSPLQSKEAKEILAWLAAIENYRDDASVKKIVAGMISRVEMSKIELEQLSEGRKCFFDCLYESGATNNFLKTYDILCGMYQTNRSRKDWLCAAAQEISDVRRMYNTNGVISVIRKWENRQLELGEPVTAADFLGWVRMCNVMEKPAKEITPDRIHLMTVHGSKGLEFDMVYIIGAAEGLFPSRGDIEEERRLFYVAMTRAREKLTVSRPLVLAGWNGGNPRETRASRFIGEASVSDD